MTTTSPRPFELPDTTPRQRRRWRKRIALTVVGVVVVTATGFGIHQFLTACGGLGSGVSRVDGECVGVTDGSYHFDPALADVSDKIARENARISGSDHTVTIALLNPFTATDTSALSIENIRNQLEGAYAAQHRINHTQVVGDRRPLIRLVLASEGSHQRQWEPVVRQLTDMVDAQAPLVAVVGMGVSVMETELAAKSLAAHNIPMVAAITTADQLNYVDIPGFMRVAPSNRDYVASLQAYIQRRPELDSAILVYDANSDSGSDIFTKSLRDDFSNSMSGLIKFSAQNFIGASVPSDANPSMFSNITSNICAVRPKIVLYAGRQVDLKSFLASLQDRVCSQDPITIVVGGTDLGALNRDAEELRKSKITVVYAAATDPNGWAVGVPGTPAHFDEFWWSFHQELGFDDAHLDDGGAIAFHDALLTAARATRLAAAATPASSGSKPRPADVRSQLLNLNNLYLVPGASGDLSFSYRGENSGNPSGKPIPVLEIPPPSTPLADTEPVYITE